MIVPKRPMRKDLSTTEITVEDFIIIINMFLVEMLVQRVFAWEVVVADTSGNLANELFPAPVFPSDDPEPGVAVELPVRHAFFLVTIGVILDDESFPTFLTREQSESIGIFRIGTGSSKDLALLLEQILGLDQDLNKTLK